VEERPIAAFQARVEARLAAARPALRPVTGPVRVTAEDVVLRDTATGNVIEVPRLAAILEAPALARGRVVARRVLLTEPEIVLGARPGAPLDPAGLFRGLGRRRGAGPTAAPPGGPIVIEELLVRGARLVLGPPAQRVVLTDLDAALPYVRVRGVGNQLPLARVARLSATLRLADTLERPLRVADGEVTFPAGRIDFQARTAVFGTTQLAGVTGTYDGDLPGLGVQAQARVLRLAFSEWQAFFPALPDEGTATFTLAIEPVAPALTGVRITELAAAVGGAEVRGSIALASGAAGTEIGRLDVAFSQLPLSLLEPVVGPLPYTGTMDGEIAGPAEALAFDVTAQLAPAAGGQAFTAGLTGRLALGPAGARLRALEADLQQVPLAALRAVAPGLPVEGLVTGRVTLAGSPGSVPLGLDIRLEVGAGTALMQGTLDLTGAVPRYDLTGRLVRVSLPAVLQPEVPPLFLTADYAVAGTGTDSRTATLHLSLSGTFSGWLAGPGDALQLQATLEGGLLALETLEAEAGPVQLVARGTWATGPVPAAGIRYTLAIADLESVAPYIRFLPPGIAGALRTSGEMAGTSDAPAFDGTLTAQDVTLAGWSVATIAAEYEYAATAPVPLLIVQASGGPVVTPGAGAYESAVLDLRMTRPTFTLDFRADRIGGGGAELAAEGTVVPEGPTDLILRTVELDLDQERWSLRSPAGVSLTPDSITVRGLLLRQVNGPGLIAVDGRLPPTEQTTLRIDVAALPLTAFAGFVRGELPVAGVLWGTVVIAGPAEAPVATGDFRLTEGRLLDVAMSWFTANARYEAGSLALVATALPAEGGRPLELRASVPARLELGIVPSLTTVESGPVDGRIVVDSLPLGVLAALTPQVTQPEGFLSGTATLAGTFESPLLGGEFRLNAVAFTVPRLNQRYSRITGQLQLEGGGIVLRDVRAFAEGWATVSGRIDFPQLDRPVADLYVDLAGFQPIGVEQMDGALATGSLRITGPLSAPVIAGNVELDDGGLPVPSTGPDESVFTPADTPSEAPVALGPNGLDGGEVAGVAPFFETLRIDRLQLRAGDDLWFLLGEDARAQLQGDLTVYKDPATLRVFGTLTGDQGVFTLRAGLIVRRFDLVSAEVRFVGSDSPNPALDILAERTVIGPDGRPIDIQVHVGGTFENPTLEVRTADGQTVPESELLSFLLFGRPSFALGGVVPGADILEEAFFTGLADLATLELEEALVRDLGLPVDVFQIRPGTAPDETGLPGFGTPTLVFGREVADEVFLTIEQGVGAIFGEASFLETWAVRLQWHIDREWLLDAGVEPLDRSRLFQTTARTPPVTERGQQFTIDLRRRWTY